MPSIDRDRCVAKSIAAKKLWKNKKYRRKMSVIRKAYYLKGRMEYEKINGKGSWHGRHFRETKAALIKAYGGKCKCCGETIPEFLTLDHTCKKTRELHRKVGMGGRLYKWLERQGYPRDGIRLLCMNCNLATSWGRICPHKKNNRRSYARSK